MKRLPLILTTCIVLVIAGGYYAYETYFTKTRVNPWDIIPQNALIVYERNNCKTCIEEIQRSAVWRIIQQAAFYNKSVDTLSKSLATNVEAANQLLISVHATKKDDFDFVFYIPDAEVNLASLINAFNKRSNRLTKREFNSIDIHEISFSKEIFSWALIDNVWVGSFTPFLVEDVIRTSIRHTGLHNIARNDQYLPLIREDAGNIYLQLHHFPDLLSIFYNDRQPAQRFGKYALFDIKFDVNNIALNGFSTDTTEVSQYLLSIFRNQSPVPFNLKNLVSSSTIALHTYGISNGSTFGTDLRKYQIKHSVKRTDSLDIIGSKSKVDFSDVFKNISHEVGLGYLESSKTSKLSKILLIETSDSQHLLRQLNRIADTFSVDTVFFDRYGSYEIREVPVFRFAEKLLWPLVTGFDQSFYTNIGNVVLICDNLQDLKLFLNHVEDDDTWGKSVVHNRFLETTLLESNVSLYVNTPKVWSLISDHMQPKWQKFVRENAALLRSIQLSAIQFSHLKNSYYTNVSLNYKPVSEVSEAGTRREKSVTNFAAGVQGLYGVKSHVNRSDEMLVQDSINDLSLVSTDGNVLWKKPVGDRITSEITQIDFFANGKLQYFFTTRAGLHVVDRLGNDVDPFPQLLSSIEFQFASVVDYDHSKKYRFLVADVNGKLWMYDKEFTNLEGWQPKDVGGPLACAPRHIRIKGKDYIVAVRKDGIVYVTNRRGEDVRNFPLKLDARIGGEYFVDPGNSPGDTYFTVIADDGYKIRFSLEGKILSRETLFKTSVNSRFSLVAENNYRTYLVIQQDATHFNIFSSDGKKVISNETIGSNPAEVKYFDFGSGRIYITVTDKLQGMSYIYDGSGKLISDPAVLSAIVELRPKDNDENRLFFVQGNTLTIQPIDR